MSPFSWPPLPYPPPFPVQFPKNELFHTAKNTVKQYSTSCLQSHESEMFCTVPSGGPPDRAATWRSLLWSSVCGGPPTWEVLSLTLAICDFCEIWTSESWFPASEVMWLNHIWALVDGLTMTLLKWGPLGVSSVLQTILSAGKFPQWPQNICFIRELLLGLD